MTPFNEFDHPRAGSGKFTEKAFTADTIATLERPSRDQNPSSYDVYVDDAPWQHAEKPWERYATEKPGSVFAPRIWEKLEEADSSGDLGNTYRLDPRTGVIQRVHETQITHDSVEVDGEVEWPDDLAFSQQFEPYESLGASNWEYNLGDIVGGLEDGETLLIETQPVQEYRARDEDGNEVADCTCADGTHSYENGDCDGELSDSFVGWAMMARIERPTV